MKLSDMKVSVQLALGLLCILCFVVLLGIVAYVQEERLWEETKGLYDHPLQVRRAIAETEVSILIMQRGMKDLILTGNESERRQILLDIDAADAHTQQQLEVLYDRYLGPRSDVDRLQTHLMQWRSIRAETIRLVQSHQYQEATDRIKPSGICNVHVGLLTADIRAISDFAKKRGDLFFQTAEQEKNDLIIRLGIILTIILLLTITVSYLLIRTIREPLKEMTSVTRQFQEGRLDVRSRYASENEFGLLSSSLNTHIAAVEAEMMHRKQTAAVSDILIREEEMGSLCRELLQALLSYMQSQIGAVYLLNADKTEYVLFESVGLSPECKPSFSVLTREGEFGPSLMSRSIHRITDIPENSFCCLTTTSGIIRPREIVTIPILQGKEIVAMLSLSSINPFSPAAIWLIESISDILTARFNGILAHTRLNEFSRLLEAQNKELKEQSRELVSQTGELKEQNIELEVQKKQLDEANRLKSVFLSNMSHELRTPLNSVIALSGVLSRRLKGSIPAEESGYLEVIERNGRLLLSLINDILDIARIESGREDVCLSSVSIQGMIATVLDIVRPQAEEKGISLTADIGPDLPAFSTDLSKCQHIVLNLVANAVKFTKSGGVTITVRVSDSLDIAVQDTGIGILPDMIPHIFDEFRQADERIGRTYGGTGLGLAIARKYAHMLGGSISVESVPDAGSTFTLHLPLEFSPACVESTQPGNHAHPAKPQGQILHKPGTGKTILLVEDNEPAIIQIRDLLEEQGYRILVAKDGREALTRVTDTLPDAVILDLMMPEVDGFTVLHMIRSQEQTADLPVLILTAKHITREELNFLQGNHIHQLIQKGDISRSGLLDAVRTMVSGSGNDIHPDGVASDSSPSPISSTFPASSGLSAPARAGSSPSTPASRVQQPTILVIEDNPDNLLTIRALLSGAGVVLEASDGEIGLDLARRHHPDLILLDISLPVMDGFAVLDSLKHDEHLAAIPVIAITARAMKGDREEMMAAGFDGYLSKPIDAELLKQTLERVL